MNDIYDDHFDELAEASLELLRTLKRLQKGSCYVIDEFWEAMQTNMAHLLENPDLWE